MVEDDNNFASSLLIINPSPIPIGFNLWFSASSTFENSLNKNYKFSDLIPIPESYIEITIESYFSCELKHSINTDPLG